MLVQEFRENVQRVVPRQNRCCARHVTPTLPAAGIASRWSMGDLPRIFPFCCQLFRFICQVKSPDSKKPKKPSADSVGEPSDGKPTKGDPVQGEATAPDSLSRSVSADKANGSDPGVEQARAAFQGLQASVVENAQVRLLSCASQRDLSE